MLTRYDRFEISLQRWLVRSSTPALYGIVWVWMRINRGYSIRNLSQVRNAFRSWAARGEGPILICSNHLTLVDSMLLIWALGTPLSYLLSPDLYPWNLPERRNFQKNLLLRALCYFGKCIPVMRGGPRDKSLKTLERIRYVLNSGDSVMIFPEGTRSRTGSVDTENFSYATGQILQGAPKARVLCVYIRGIRQKAYSDFPARQEEITVDLRPIRPRARGTGLRAAKEISTRVIRHLKAMEAAYDARHANNRQ